MQDSELAAKLRLLYADLTKLSEAAPKYIEHISLKANPNVDAWWREME